MTNFPIIDLVVGLIFIFFILSIITSSVVEIFMSRLKVRNKFLAQWLLTIFDKKMIIAGKQVVLGQAIIDHCLTTALSGEGKATSFMDAKNFVSTLLEKLTYDPNNPLNSVFQNLDDLLTKMKAATAADGSPLIDPELMRTILIFGTEAKAAAEAMKTSAAIVPAKSELDIFREKLEHWFDSSMDRVTGKMKGNYIRPLTFWTGLAVVVALNVNTIQISKYLYDHKEEAKQFADKATASYTKIKATTDAIPKLDTMQKADTAALRKTVESIRADIDTLKNAAPKGMPLGWDDNQKAAFINDWIISIIGWLATVMAIMLGAPFWFDLLNKIANIRGSGAKPASSTDKDGKTS